MKIGILTFHRTTNFGSMLQTYGLYEALQKFTTNCEIIDYRCPAIENREHLKAKLTLGNPRQALKVLLFQPALDRKAKSLLGFLNRHMKVSTTYTPETIALCENNYDKVFVGSDIVWGRDITNNDYNYFLEFINNPQKKYAFSSSVGTSKVTGEEEKLNKLLNEFQLIAVREEDTVEWVRKVSGREAFWVCDPTMLLTIDEWKAIVPPRYNTKKKYVLVYFEDSKGKALEDAIEYAKQHDMKVWLINYGVPKKRVKNIKPESLEEFLGLVDGASCVFTASYHGMLFSIYFNKPLFFYTRAHASRMLSLSKRLRLDERCGDNIDIMQAQDIDYNEVNMKVAQFRSESIKILKKMLEVKTWS